MEAFEKEFANFHGEQFFAVGLLMGLTLLPYVRSLGMGKNDEIITVYTAVAIAGIEQAGVHRYLQI